MYYGILYDCGYTYVHVQKSLLEIGRWRIVRERQSFGSSLSGCFARILRQIFTFCYLIFPTVGLLIYYVFVPSFF